jgi:hypothetical protein
MSRGIRVLGLLLLLAVQLSGAITMMSWCAEPCPEDAGDDCPPVCAVCTSCAHVKLAIVARGEGRVTLAASHPVAPSTAGSLSVGVSSEILHVPLAG